MVAGKLTLITSDTEIWKTIPSYPKYEASSDGRIRNKKSGKVLSPVIINGYYVVGLMEKVEEVCKKIHRRVARLVAETFIENPDPVNKTQVNHKGGRDSRKDNSIGNLEWVSASENTRHYYAEGGRQKRQPLEFENETEVVWVCSMFEATRYFNCAIGTICGAVQAICDEKTQKKWRGYTIKKISQEEYLAILQKKEDELRGKYKCKAG